MFFKCNKSLFLLLELLKKDILPLRKAEREIERLKAKKIGKARNKALEARVFFSGYNVAGVVF